MNDRRRLGGTDVYVSRVGYGGGALYEYGPTPDDQALAAVRKAVDMGFAHIDTAPDYGSGTCESIIGGAVGEMQRSDFTVSTKVGRVLVPSEPRWAGGPRLRAVFDFSEAGVRGSFEGSLARLRLSEVDVLLIHDCDSYVDQALSYSYKVISELKERGATRAIGAGLNSCETALKLARRANFDCFLVAGRYTLLEQGALDELIPTCADRGIGLMIGAPFNSGILASPDLVHGVKYNYADPPPHILEKARKIKALCEANSTPLRAAALQFILANPAVTSVIPGCKSVAEVEDLALALSYSIPGRLWDDLKSEGLIREGAPVPRAQSDYA